ncbi:tail fiber assembly protein [Xenorhabdus khoisanae]|uniref:tail fiber assembly protein n=1 Tax=Xenorhabdus khoisanae TaxID=880157 RepID=UPI002359A974|nr:tail fiber assembly protein [Xenorhabdus khoisanae]MDC9614087.1 tail fiber assembly protein [Xenorhabdus khoisanae]
MNYYINEKTREIYAYESEQFVQPGLIPITEAEADAILNPPELLQQRAESEKRYRLLLAANAIAPLQDAIDLDMATDAEKSALTEWRKYRVLLNRVDCATAPDIPWPEQPK